MYKKITGTHTFTTISTLALTLALGACGGGGDDESLLDKINNGGSGSNTSSSSSGSNSSQPNTTDVQQLGYHSGESFQAGVIGVGIEDSILSAGGTTTLTVHIVSNSGDLVTEPVTVIFNSRCVAANTSVLAVNNTPTTNITSSTGAASITYTANGCVGEDKITASVNHNGNLLNAQATINIEADTVQSITFVEAVPDLISLKGTGGEEASAVHFLVKGSNGTPIKDVCVDFSLNTTAGGLQLTNSKCEKSDPDGSTRSKTGADGRASIFVQAGTIATPVTVTARDLQTGLSTQSRNLRVSTGVPDQKSMSLSASVKNPSAWEYDGEPVTFTILLADAFNNPPANGTVVSFTTSGGAIVESCITENGKCEAVWRSQDPRPQGGRVTILAHTTGNESFMDTNGNGWFDKVDTFAIDSEDIPNPNCKLNSPPSSASLIASPCDDLPEAYLDADFDGARDTNEPFIDFNEDGQYSNFGDTIYNGVLCRTEDIRTEEHPDGICTRDGVTIRKDYLIVMSSEHPQLDQGRLLGQPATLIIAPRESVEIDVLLADINGNPLPAGTTVAINTSEAENLSAVPSSLTIPSTTSPQRAKIRLRGNSDTDEPSGLIFFEITGPKGLTTLTEVTDIN